MRGGEKMNLFGLDVSMLKYFCQERKRIDEKIEEYSKSNTYVDVVILCVISTNSIAKIIKEVLDRSEKSWFDLRIELHSLGESGLITKNVFILGQKGIILKNLKEISENVLYLKGLRKYCLWVGLDIELKPKIEDLI